MNWSIKEYDLPLFAIIILAALHVVGITGLNTSYHEYIEKIAWLNLLISAIVVIGFHTLFNNRLMIFISATFVIGMAVEIIGVSTGQPFGQYHYTGKFGWQLMGVPFIIGINWVLLGYVCGNIAQQH